MNDPDAHIRSAAFSAMEKLVRYQPDGLIRWDAIHRGFQVGSEHIHFANRAQGIFKPRQMSAALSIKTVVPRAGRPTWYSDQGLASSKLDALTGLWHYDLAHGGLDDHTNRALQTAMYRGAPLIYFIGVREKTYQPVFPVWVEEFDPEVGRVLLAAADMVDNRLSSVAAARNNLPLSVETSWTLRTTRVRNHQAWFSTRTKAAYRWRCAFSGLPVRQLLVGAHIVPDAEEGEPTVANGLALCKLHHAAFDRYFLGVRPDYVVQVRPDLLKETDGPTLVHGIQALHGTRITVPRKPRFQPDRHFLEIRYENFRRA